MTAHPLILPSAALPESLHNGLSAFNKEKTLINNKITSFKSTNSGSQKHKGGPWT